MNLKHYDFFARLNFRLQRLASRFPDLIIANSEAGRAYHLSRGFPAQKFIVINNGIDTEQFRPERGAGKRSRASWRIADDASLIGLVGRLDQVKDHPAFLEAAELLARHRQIVGPLCL